MTPSQETPAVPAGDPGQTIPELQAIISRDKVLIEHLVSQLKSAKAQIERLKNGNNPNPPG